MPDHNKQKTFQRLLRLPKILKENSHKKVSHRALRRVHSHATFSRAFQCCINHENPTKIGQSSYLEVQVALPDQLGGAGLSRNAQMSGKMRF